MNVRREEIEGRGIRSDEERGLQSDRDSHYQQSERGLRTTLQSSNGELKKRPIRLGDETATPRHCADNKSEHVRLNHTVEASKESDMEYAYSDCKACLQETTSRKVLDELKELREENIFFKKQLLRLLQEKKQQAVEQNRKSLEKREVSKQSSSPKRAKSTGRIQFQNNLERRYKAERKKEVSPRKYKKEVAPESQYRKEYLNRPHQSVHQVQSRMYYAARPEQVLPARTIDVFPTLLSTDTSARNYRYHQQQFSKTQGPFMTQQPVHYQQPVQTAYPQSVFPQQGIFQQTSAQPYSQPKVMYVPVGYGTHEPSFRRQNDTFYRGMYFEQPRSGKYQRY